MAKQKNNAQKRKAQPKQRIKRVTLPPPQMPGAGAFGPVSTITSAPVAIGNSIKGTSPSVTMAVDGCRVVGRDFAFTAASTPSSVTGWTLVGGMPITPSVLPSSALKSYCQMYSKFRVNSIAFHYITSSATSQTGDVLFYVERDRAGPFIDWSNSSFLPYTLSDPHTVLGPQWTNHTAVYRPTNTFKYTDYGINVDVNEDACGAVYLFSKTSSASSPGYVLVDYDITFKELQVNPRAGVLPISRGQINQVCWSASGVAATSGNTSITVSGNTGTSITGATSALPNGTIAGDIYRCVADVTTSIVLNTWTNVTAANLFNYELPGGNDSAVTIDDGFTFYAVMTSTTGARFYPTLASALGAGNGFTYGVTATVTFGLCASISLVGQLNSQSQAAY
jgi:hypothetical protein